MIIKKYKLFLEASLKDLLKLSGNSDSELAKQMAKIKEEEFNLLQKLPKQIKLDNDSTLKVNWYDTASHNLVQKIKERTAFASINHFTEYLQKKLTEVFPYMLGKELFKTGRYTIYLKEYNVSIIIGFDLNKNLGKSYFINIITILPGKKGNNIIGYIEI